MLFAMSAHSNNPDKLAYSSRCLPGSLAEQQEQERMAEFQRRKAEERAEAVRTKPIRDAQREQEYQATFEANRARIQREKAARSTRNGYPRA